MSVFKDKKTNLWIAEVQTNDYTPSGKRKRLVKTKIKTKREALDWERDQLNKLDGQKETKFKVVYKDYIDKISDDIKYSTLQTKLNYCEQHILPYFKNKRICDISALDITNWQKQMKQKGLSATTLRTVNSQFNAIMNYAEKFYNLVPNPVRKVKKMGKRTGEEKEAISLDVFNKVRLEAREDPVTYTVMHIGFLAGLRINEILALTKKDLYLDSKRGSYIYVRHTIAKAPDGGYELTLPKSNKKRIVAIPEVLAEVISDYISINKYLGEYDLLFPITYGTFNRKLKKFCKLAGVDEVYTSHIMRHSFVTNGAKICETGLGLKVVSKMVGHSDLTTSMIYTHVDDDSANQLAQDINKWFIEGIEENENTKSKR